MIWGFASALLYGVCAAVYGALCAIVLVQTRLNRSGAGFAAALGVTAAWATASAVGWSAPLAGAAGGLDLLRAAIWSLFLLNLYRESFGRNTGLGRSFAVTGLIMALLIGVVMLFTPVANGSASPLSAGIAARLLLAIAQLLLLENLYANTPADHRWSINLTCVALGGICLYDVVLCADAVLFRQVSSALAEGRVAAVIFVAPLLALAAARNRHWKVDIHVSRQVAFHSVTLLASGIFLLALAGAGEVFRHLAARWGGVAEVSLIFAGLTTIAVLVTSGSARSQLNSLVVAHFFSHRYDYRREWQRCIDTLSDTTATAALHRRVIRTVAQVVDSPGGVLFLREGEAFHWAGSWNMPAAPLPIAGDHALPTLLGGGIAVVLDRRTGPRLPDELARAWLAAPLCQAGRLAGFVLVAPPRASLKVDGEVAGLLRIVGREVAAYIAEQQATQSLVETRQLRSYGKRFAFVAHDIKNVSSQLSLLLSNAELHLQNPEFQHDMLTTVRASVQKIQALLLRLQSPADETDRTVIAPLEQLEALVATCRRVRGVTIDLTADGRSGEVVMDPDSFEAVVTHLLDNAIEAAGRDLPIRLHVHNEGRRMRIDIADSGPGMTPEFIRDRLFRPFATSKLEGSGIGAFQARELLREAGGDLTVLSEPGAGTTMRLLLPLVESASRQAAPPRLRVVG